jgi:hypothetical protein
VGTRSGLDAVEAELYSVCSNFYVCGEQTTRQKVQDMTFPKFSRLGRWESQIKMCKDYGASLKQRVQYVNKWVFVETVSEMN